MKKILFLIVTFICGVNICYASNHIYSIDSSIYIDEEGTATIKEVWNVAGSNGTEWYKAMYNLGNSKISDFTVSMDGVDLTYKNWNVSESLNEKKGFYGINYTSSGPELCFGKYDYKKHTFTLNYKISNFIFNVSDAQVIYFKFIDTLSDVTFDDFSITISTYYDLPDTTDVWGYGYNGYAYVSDGKIYLSNKDLMEKNYVVLLAKFPIGTFKTTNSYSKYSDFSSILSKADEGTFEYVYNNSYNSYNNIATTFVFCWAPLVLLVLFAFFSELKNTKFGYIDNKVINKNNTNFYRDIPCGKDIYYANALARLNSWSNSDTNILGAIFLKWIKNGTVSIIKDGKSVKLQLNGSNITNPLETKFYDMVYKASIDGILEKNELKKYASKNYSSFLNLFTKIKNNKIDELKNEGHIFKRTDKKMCKYKNVMDDTLYYESQKLYGLKLFLTEFSNIKQREAIEVNLWDEYLMYAYIFGIADKVVKQFKNLYPEVVVEMQNMNMDFDTFIFINDISRSSVLSARSAKSEAEAKASSYSSGGGGFSSGGGGGGSFGGGGGGSR